MSSIISDGSPGVHAPTFAAAADQAIAVARELDNLAYTGQLADARNMASVLHQIADLLATIGRLPEPQP